MNTADSSTTAGRSTVAQGARRAFVLALVAVGVLAPVLLLVARWPQWWAWIASEQTPMTWLQSVVLVLAAAASGLIAMLQRMTGASRAGASMPGVGMSGSRVPGDRAWPLLAVGFAALAFDERFAVHERLRDGVLAPRGVALPFLPWVAPGDFLILGVAVVGLALLPMVLQAVRDDRGSRNALLVGVAFAVGAVGMDSIDPSTWTVHAERVQQTLEEVVELASGLCFLGAVGLRLLRELGHLTADAAVTLTQADADSG